MAISIRRLASTIASLHEPSVSDLSNQEQTIYRDKGISGGASVINGQDDASGSPWSSSFHQGETKKPGDQPDTSPRGTALCVIKRYFHAGHVLVTTVARVHLANVFACFNYNLLQLRTIQRRERAER